jgi:TnpA family transposase
MLIFEFPAKLERHHLWVRNRRPAMKKHEILSPQSWAELFDPPTDPAAIVRQYTFSLDDLTLICQRRLDANRLGFAVHLAYLKFPGRVLGSEEAPASDMVAFLAQQLGVGSDVYNEYARRDETRREHLGDIQSYLCVRPFSRDDYRYVAKIATDEAIGTDRGHAIVAAMIEALRSRGILLPAPTILERIGLAARARARKQAHRNLVEGLEQRTVNELQALIVVIDDRDRTRLAWLRDWPETPTQKNLVGVVERLQFVRSLGVGPDREQRIHRARYRAIAKETAILSAQHLSRFDTPRRLATLVVFVREIEAILTDAALVMFDKMLGGVYRRAERAYRENVVHRAKAIDASARALLYMAKAMLAAKESGEDQDSAVERSLGWERLKALVAETEIVVTNTREDNLTEIVERYPTVRRMTPVLLNAFVFRSWKPNDSLLDALDLLRGLYAARPRQLPQRPPTAFLKATWRKLVGRGSTFDRRAYEVAVMMTLRDSLRSGDIWVEGSRAFRAFGDFLLPPEAFVTRRQEGELGLAVPDRFDDWRAERTALLESRLNEIDTLASAGRLVEATITAEGLSISPIRKDDNDEVDDFARRLYGMLPRLRITELIAEVNGWTGFAERFGHLRTGAPPEESVGLMTALLADVTNLGLARMARSSKIFSHSKLLWIAEWHVRDETYQAALACLIEAIHAQPFTRVWGDGGTSSSDGQFFKAGGHGEARADYNAKYGSEPGVKFYTHVSDRYSPFHTKVIAANASEAAHILDGLLHHECSLDIRDSDASARGLPQTECAGEDASGDRAARTHPLHPRLDQRPGSEAANKRRAQQG